MYYQSYADDARCRRTRKQRLRKLQGVNPFTFKVRGLSTQVRDARYRTSHRCNPIATTAVDRRRAASRLGPQPRSAALHWGVSRMMTCRGLRVPCCLMLPHR